MWRGYTCHFISLTLTPDPFCFFITVLERRLVLSHVFLRADVQITSKEGGRALILHCSAAGLVISTSAKWMLTGRAVNGYTRCIGKGEQDTGSIDLADHE